MISKPNGYDETTAIRGGAAILPAGNYSCVIVNAREEHSKKGNQMLVLYVDIVDGPYRDYFTAQYNRSALLGEPKWNNGGIYRQLTEGNSKGFFKGLLEVLHESNPAFDNAVWPLDEKRLIGLMFAGQFQEEEYENPRGELKTRTQLAYINPLNELDTLPVLPKKPLLRPSSSWSDNPFVPPAPTDADAPF